MRTDKEEDGMEEVKQYKKDFSKVGGSFALGTVFVLILQSVVAFALGKLKPEWLLDTNISMVISSITMYGLTFPLIILLAGKLPAAAPAKHGIKGGQMVVAAIMSMTVMYFSNMVGLVLTTIIGILKGGAVGNPAQSAIMAGNLPLMFLLMVLLAPVMEELLFRKILIDRVARYGEGVAILLSGLMFAFFHGNLNQFVYAFALGVFFAFLYVKTGDVRITMILHGFVNFMGSIVAQLMLKAVDYEEMLTVDLADEEAVMAFTMEHMGGWMIFMLYAVVLFGLVITGAILFIVFAVKKRFALKAGDVVIPRGRKFQTVFLNLGMLAYCLIWIVIIVLQLLE